MFCISAVRFKDNGDIQTFSDLRVFNYHFMLNESRKPGQSLDWR